MVARAVLAGGLSTGALGRLARLKNVAQVDDEYLARWDARAWRAWDIAAGAWREQADECPVLPEWMRPLCFPRGNDFSVPFPAVAGLWPTGHDWFAEADRHEDFRLDAGFFGTEGVPGLEAIGAAWEYAAGEGLEPALALSVVPVEPWGRPAVLSAIEGFAVFSAPREQDAVLRGLLTGFRRRTDPVSGWDAAGRPVTAWEWLGD